MDCTLVHQGTNMNTVHWTECTQSVSSKKLEGSGARYLCGSAGSSRSSSSSVETTGFPGSPPPSTSQPASGQTKAGDKKPIPKYQRCVWYIWFQTSKITNIFFENLKINVYPTVSQKKTKNPPKLIWAPHALKKALARSPG